MASDLSALTGPRATQRVTMNATAGLATAVTFPTWTRRVKVQFFEGDDATDEGGKVAYSGTDGAAIGNHWFRVPAANALEISLTSDGVRMSEAQVLYFAADSNSAHAHFLLEG